MVGMMRGIMGPGPSPRRAARVAVAALLLFAAAFAIAARPDVAQASVGKGLIVSELDAISGDPGLKAGAVAEAANDLKAGWVRLAVSWAALEPSRGVYSESALANLDYSVNELHARGVKLVLTFVYTPRWASDSSFWDNPPGDHPTGYSVRYPIRDDALADMGATAAMLAARYAGLVNAYECWNEPNLWPYIYPQRTASDEYFGASTYLKYLKAFSAGVKRGDSAALVVAGSTGPVGQDDKLRTSPQKFARFLAGAGAGAWFDVYSHHPYTPGGSVNKAPDRRPNDPSTTVTLWNLGRLLALFPDKPFYLTEYGYNTHPSNDFGRMTVTKVQQATYLKKAYAYAGRFSQVKNLFWFLIRDARPASGPAEAGVYTGLRESGGRRKLSWFAYAGRNRLTIAAPRSARYGAVIRVTGRLTNAVVGGVADRTLVLQARRKSGKTWRTVASTHTSSAGYYRLSVRPPGIRVYRVVWRGVKVSAKRTVWVY